MNKKRHAFLVILVLILFAVSIAYAIPIDQKNKLVNGVKNYNDVIELTGNIHPQELVEEVKALGLYNLDTISISRNGTKFLLYPKYYETKAQYNESLKIASKIAVETKGMTEKEKVMYITQRISHLMKYEDNQSRTKFSPYAVIEGGGVCQAYARFADMVFSEAGIRSSIVTGTRGNDSHMWNNVRVGGSTYAIDITNADTDENNLIDWSYIFMSVSELNNRNYKIGTTSEQVNNVSMKDKISSKGMVSIRDGLVYSPVNAGLVGIPLNSKYSMKTVELGALGGFYVAGDRLVILKDNKLIAPSEGSIMNNVKTNNIKFTGSAVYVNDEVAYAPITTPKDMITYVDGDYNVKFKANGYSQEKIDGRTCIYYNNKFLSEIVRR